MSAPCMVLLTLWPPPRPPFAIIPIRYPFPSPPQNVSFTYWYLSSHISVSDHPPPPRAPPPKWL
jgi:hypothetical protein